MSDSDIWFKCQTHLFLYIQGPLKLENIFDPCLTFLKEFWYSLYLKGNMVQNLLLRCMFYVCFEDLLRSFLTLLYSCGIKYESQNSLELLTNSCLRYLDQLLVDIGISEILKLASEIPTSKF